MKESSLDMGGGRAKRRVWRYLGSVAIGALWFPLAFLTLLLLGAPFQDVVDFPNWMDPRVGFTLSVFACPTGAAVSAVVYWFWPDVRWRSNFLLVVAATVALAIFAYLVGRIDSGWIGF